MLRLRDRIRGVFTKTVWLQTGKRKKLRRFKVPPSERLVLGIVFAIIALIGLVAIEVAHMAFLRAWNSEIFSAITALIGTILGVFISQKA
jgi:uncharacterized protein YqgC (DUF456 family)